MDVYEAKINQYARQIESYQNRVESQAKPKSFSLINNFLLWSAILFLFWPVGMLCIALALALLFVIVGQTALLNTFLTADNINTLVFLTYRNLLYIIVVLSLVLVSIKLKNDHDQKVYEKELVIFKSKRDLIQEKFDALAKKLNEEREQKRIAFEKERIAFEKEQIAKGLVQYEDKWGTPEQVKKWKEIRTGIDSSFMNMSHFEFEEFVARLFRKMGYETTVTKKTGDYGVDVIAKDSRDTIAIQVKQNSIGNNVGNVTVQQTLGAMWKIPANKAIIITTSDFTVQAKEQAKNAPIELWDLKILKQLVRKHFIDN